MNRAAIYARVSTHNGQNPEMQLDEVREYCRRRGWMIVGEYVDEGISGSKEHRPALDRLLADCRKRLVDAVRQQLPELTGASILGEPFKRDTAPCIGLAPCVHGRSSRAASTNRSS